MSRREDWNRITDWATIGELGPQDAALAVYNKTVERRRLRYLPPAKDIDVRFVAEGPTIIAIVQYGTEIVAGSARRSAEDAPNDDVGRTISLTRALETLDMSLLYHLERAVGFGER
jgi:hypothetical protein